MNKRLILSIGLVFLLLVSSCSLIGGEAPISNEERLAQLDRTFTKAVETLNRLYDQGKITQEQMRDVKDVIINGDKLLDSAWLAVEANSESDLETKLNKIRDVINSLRPVIEEARN